MKRALSFTKRMISAYFNNMAEMYRPAIEAGVPIHF